MATQTPADIAHNTAPVRGIVAMIHVADVAREVGYRTPSAFVAAFRKAMGTTPRRFARDPGQGNRQK